MIDNRGQLWTAEEYEQLKVEINAGLPLEEIVIAHGRTAYGIIGKLQSMGLIILVGRNYHRVDPDPWVLHSNIVEIQRGLTQK